MTFMRSTWKTVAIVIAIILVIAVITLYLTGNWVVIVNNLLKTIQTTIGLTNNQFQIPTA